MFIRKQLENSGLDRNPYGPTRHSSAWYWIERWRPVLPIRPSSFGGLPMFSTFKEALQRITSQCPIRQRIKDRQQGVLYYRIHGEYGRHSRWRVTNDHTIELMRYSYPIITWTYDDRLVINDGYFGLTDRMLLNSMLSRLLGRDITSGTAYGQPALLSPALLIEGKELLPAAVTVLYGGLTVDTEKHVFMNQIPVKKGRLKGYAEWRDNHTIYPQWKTQLQAMLELAMANSTYDPNKHWNSSDYEYRWLRFSGATVMNPSKVRDFMQGMSNHIAYQRWQAANANYGRDYHRRYLEKYATPKQRLQIALRKVSNALMEFYPLPTVSLDHLMYPDTPTSTVLARHQLER